MSGMAQVGRAEQAQRVRDHYERIWQKGDEGWTSAVNLAADAWEREPALLDEIERLREKSGRVEAENGRLQHQLQLTEGARQEALDYMLNLSRMLMKTDANLAVHVRNSANTNGILQQLPERGSTTYQLGTGEITPEGRG